MNNLPNIIILGKMRSGKSTIGNIIKNIYPEYYRLALNTKQKNLSNLFIDNKDKNRELIYRITENLATIDNYVWIKYIKNKIKNLDKPIILEGMLLLHEYEYIKDLFNWYIIKIDISKKLQKERLKNGKLINNKYENSKLKNIKYNLIIDMDFNNKSSDINSFKLHYTNILKNELNDF